MSQVKQRKRLPQNSKLIYAHELVALGDQLDREADFKGIYNDYLREISSLNIPQPTPADQYKLLHGTNASKSDWAVFATSYERLIPDHAVVSAETLEEWKAEDPYWRKRIVPWDADRDWKRSSTALQTWMQKYHKISSLEEAKSGTVSQTFLADLIGRKDTYISQNSFGERWRIVEQMAQRELEASAGVPEEERTNVEPWRRLAANTSHFGSAFLDFDDLLANHNMTPSQVAAFILATCERENLPLPSYITFTGRGIAVNWLFHHVDANQTRRWNLMMDQLMAVFEAAVPDTNVSDSSRVLRCWGTINSKSGETVRPIWINGSSIQDIHRYDFGELCDSILPYSKKEYAKRTEAKRAEIRAYWDDFNKAAKEARDERISDVINLNRPKPTQKQHKSFRSLARVIVEDLERLHVGRWLGGKIPRGHRDAWLIQWTSALSRIVSKDELRNLPAAAVLRELVKKKAREIGLHEHLAEKYMATAIERCSQQKILDRAKLDGVPISAIRGSIPLYASEGRKHDHIVYAYKPETIIQKLGIKEHEMRQFDLRSLVFTGIKLERDRVRKAESRGQVAVPRSQDEHHRERYAAALEVFKAHKEGLSIRKLAAQFGKSTRTIQKWLKLVTDTLNVSVEQFVFSHQDLVSSSDQQEQGLSEAVLPCPCIYNRSEMKPNDEDRNLLDNNNSIQLASYSLDSEKEQETPINVSPDLREQAIGINKVNHSGSPANTIPSENKGVGERTAPEVRALRSVSSASADTSRPPISLQKEKSNKVIDLISVQKRRKAIINATRNQNLLKKALESDVVDPSSVKEKRHIKHAVRMERNRLKGANEIPWDHKSSFTQSELTSYQAVLEGKVQLFRDPIHPETKAISASGIVVRLSDIKNYAGILNDLPEANDLLLMKAGISKSPKRGYSRIPDFIMASKMDLNSSAQSA